MAEIGCPVRSGIRKAYPSHRSLAMVLYGCVAYALFLLAFLYAIGFVGDLVVPKTIDGGPAGPLASALLVDLSLLALFAVQHSVMARPAFKRAWTRVVPEPIERATFILCASLVLLLLFWQWRPLAGPVWAIESPIGAGALWAAFWAGWGLVLLSTFLIDHFELFGLRQVFAHLAGRPAPAPMFKTPLLYRVVRHPLYLGFLLAFWATPNMTLGHLLFAAVTTAYILIAIQLEERDLVALFGERYRVYRRQVAMLLPLPRRKPADPAAAS
jgi:protein-S-isoprenylcysteine O-methyltransferase Ste14